MPRLLPSTLAALLGALLLSSAALAVAQQPEDTLARIKRTGVFTIGYRESSPPFSFVTKTDPKPQGYSIDLCLRVAEGIKKDLGRMAQVDFSVLTFLDGGSLLTLSEAKINRLTDVSGKRVAVIPGTTTESALRDMIKKLNLQNVTLLAVKDHAEGVAALDEAKIDAYASDRTLLAGLAVSSRNPAKLYLLEDFISYEPYALMVKRGDPNFHLAVDRTLIKLYRSAEVVPIYEKWFGPFPESGSLIAAVYVLNSVPD